MHTQEWFINALKVELAQNQNNAHRTASCSVSDRVTVIMVVSCRLSEIVINHKNIFDFDTKVD